MEEWRDIPGFRFYQASTHGRIKSLARWATRSQGDYWKKEIILKPIPDRIGNRVQRMFVNLRVDGKTITIRVHTLILMTFVGFRPVGMEACHTDGNPTNNRLDNLRWDTDKSNQADSARHGTKHPPPHNFGEMHAMSKLTAEAVAEIKATPWKRGLLVFFAKKFKVSTPTIARVRDRKTWVHQ